jgi:hypothetical protein
MIQLPLFETNRVFIAKHTTHTIMFYNKDTISYEQG